MKFVSASIVTYNNPVHVLEKAVNSFLNTSLDVHLYIIDNSPKDTLRYVFSDPRVTYIFNDKNLGYGSAHNIGITKAVNANSDYHLVLNPDVYFDGSAIEALVAYMDENPDVGLVMPRVLYPDGSEQHLCKLLPKPENLFFRRFVPLSTVVEKYNREYELRDADHDQKMNVPFLSGSFMFLRIDALKKVGLFDENIFMYLEDADLCRRLHKEYRTMYYPKVTIVHEYAKGSYRNWKLLFYHIRSALYYFTKWGWFADRERDEVNKATLQRYCRS